MRIVKYLFFPILTFAFFVQSCSEDSNIPPNVVIIQLDDLGYDDLGIHGNNLVSTPNIDSFGYRSMQFEQFYVYSLGAPTRASLLTGRHFLKTGVSHSHGGKDFLSINETTIAEVLNSAGYQTAMWGKWHSGHSAGYFPWERGFDETYMAELYKHRNSKGKYNGIAIEHDKWADQVITEYAIDFMDKNRKRPFFAYLSYLSIHAPLDTPDSLRNKYLEKGLSYNLATLYGMVEHLDYYLGELFTAMDTMGLMKNTVLFFMSDNGPALLNNLLSDEDREIRYVNDLKGHKGNIWENGVRSPLFVRWEGVTRPMVRYDLCDVTDLFPTILSLADASLPEESKNLDGVSFGDLIRHGNIEEREKVSYNYAHKGWPPKKEAWKAEGAFDEYRPVTSDSKKEARYEDQIISLRKGPFKLMHKASYIETHPMSQVKYILIDVLADPREELNLYYRMPEIADDMEGILRTWWESILEEENSFAMPVFNIGSKEEELSHILAKAPREISPGVSSAYAWLSNWRKEGDFASYNIQVETPGLYEISIRYKGKPTGARVRVSCGRESVTNTIETYDKAILGSINLDGTESELILELIENQSSADVFPALESIVLKKR